MLSSIENLVILLNKSTLTERRRIFMYWQYTNLVTRSHHRSNLCPMHFCAGVFPQFFFSSHSLLLESADFIVEDEHETRHSNIIRLLKQEVILIFVYVTAAFLYCMARFNKCQLHCYICSLDSMVN